MRKLALGLALAALAGITSQALLGEDDATIRKQIEANYEKVKEATLQRSVEAINESRKGIETGDSIFIDTKGNIYPYRPAGQEYAPVAKNIVSYEYTIKKFTVSGDEAEVWVDVKEERTETGRGSAHLTEVRQRRVTFVEHTKDTWIKTPAGWKRSMREEVAPADHTVESAPPAAPTTK